MSLMEESGGSLNDKVAEVPAEPAPAPLALDASLPLAFDDEFTPFDAMTMLHQCLHVDATNDAMVHECQGAYFFFVLRVLKTCHDQLFSSFQNLCALHAFTIGKQHAQNLRSLFVRGVVLADEIMERLNKNGTVVDDHAFWLETYMMMWNDKGRRCAFIFSARHDNTLCLIHSHLTHAAARGWTWNRWSASHLSWWCCGGWGGHHSHRARGRCDISCNHEGHKQIIHCTYVHDSMVRADLKKTSGSINTWWLQFLQPVSFIFIWWFLHIWFISVYME